MRRALVLTAALFAASASARSAQAQVRVATFEKPAVALDLYGWVSPRVTYDHASGDEEGKVIFDVPQARLGAVATLGTWARMHTEIDFATVFFPSAPTQTRTGLDVLDAYAVFMPYRSRFFGVELTLGRFRVPFSRQNLLQPFGLQTGQLASSISDLLPGRQVGGMLGLDTWDRKIRLQAGVFNSGWGKNVDVLGSPGGLSALELDKNWFLYAGRLEFSPLGPAPSFEGDVRPVSQRRRPIVAFGASALHTSAGYRFTLGDISPGSFAETRLGLDVGVWYSGASLYAEFLASMTESLPAAVSPIIAETNTWRSTSTNVQLGYFLPIGLLREHLELVGRIQFGERTYRIHGQTMEFSLDTITTGGGLNVFFDRGHHLKTQIFYDTEGIHHRLSLQATAGF